MKRLLIAALLLLAACRDEQVARLQPVALTAEATGYFCQMNLMEHPGPKAQVHVDGMPGMPLFFSQVRDAIAFARMPEQDYVIRKIYVNDMGAKGATWDQPGAENWIAADEAVYVIGSARQGGMGAAETVPFSRREDALAFAAANGGNVVSLSDIPDALVLAPAGPAAQTDGSDSQFEQRLRDLARRPKG
jgi:copper chaperone NosL